MGKRQKTVPQPRTFPFQQPEDITLISKRLIKECKKLPIGKALEK